MSEKLKKVLLELGLDPEEEYYIGHEGKIIKKGLVDEYTGLYINHENKIMREEMLMDKPTNIFIDREGKLKKQHMLHQEDLGIKIRNDGVIMEEDLLGYRETDHYIDRNGNLRREGLLGKTDRIKTPSSTPFRTSSPSSDGDTIFKLGFWLALIAIGLLVLAYMLAAAVVLLPVIALIMYWRKKQKGWLWISALSAIVFLWGLGYGRFAYQFIEYNFIRDLGLPHKTITWTKMIYGISLILSGWFLYQEHNRQRT